MKDLEYGIENMEQMEEIEKDGKRKQRDIERKWKNEINRVGIPTVLYCRLRSRLSEGGGARL